MHAGEDVTQESLRDLAVRVVGDARTYAKAELNVVRQTVNTKVAQATPAAGMIVAALLLLPAAITILAAALALLLARWLGLPGGFAVAGLLVAVLAGILVLVAVKRIKGMFK